MHHLPSLFSFLFSQFLKYRFKQRQNAPITVLIFKHSRIAGAFLMKSKQVLFFSLQFQKVSQCARKRPCFKMISAVPNRFKNCQNAPFTVLVVIFSPKFQIALNAVRMNHLPSMLSKCSVLIFFCSSQNSFRCRENAPFIVLVFKMCLQFQIVSNTLRMHHLLSLF